MEQGNYVIWFHAVRYATRYNNSSTTRGTWICWSSPLQEWSDENDTRYLFGRLMRGVVNAQLVRSILVYILTILAHFFASIFIKYFHDQFHYSLVSSSPPSPLCNLCNFSISAPVLGLRVNSVRKALPALPCLTVFT